MFLRICGSFKTTKTDWVRKSQHRKLIHLRNVRKSKHKVRKNLRTLRFAELICRTPTVGNFNVLLGAAAGIGEHQSRDGGPQHGAKHKDL